MELSKLSESQEDYLKNIYKLGESGEAVPTVALSEELCVKPASVTNMLKKLAEMKLLEHQPYKGVRLTRAGEKIALEILRHHRLLELYLAEVHGYGWEEVHDEAERLEHVISENFEAKIAEMLGHPQHDPHGDPIPNAELKIPAGPSLVSLNHFKPGWEGTIKRVTSQDTDVLNMLTRLELILDSMVKVIRHEKQGIRVQVNDNNYLLPVVLATQIWVEG
ncbi:MAG: metal-dependent transcriptional regulator [Balneolales bacterium]